MVDIHGRRGKEVLGLQDQPLNIALKLAFELIQSTNAVNVQMTRSGDVTITSGNDGITFMPNESEKPLLKAVVGGQKAGLHAGTGAPLDIVVVMLRHRTLLNSDDEQRMRAYPTWEARQLSTLVLLTMQPISRTCSVAEALDLMNIP